ncbi:MAG TPA: endonuclease/exonuclease/phosphatase family protein [Pirellulales bacterium]|nr:endonuclease/exonuclease/phosphatase family protein [Pirellulales bacterium]
MITKTIRSRRPHLVLFLLGSWLVLAGCNPVARDAGGGDDKAGTTAGQATAASNDSVKATANSEKKEKPALSIDEALPTIAWNDADRFLGRQVYLIGRVQGTGTSDGGHVFLNFPANGQGSSLTGFIYHTVARQFPVPPQESFPGKLVKIRGELYLYDNVPNIRIASPQDIEVLPDDTPLPGKAQLPPPRPRNTEFVTIASYNVLNMFDAFDDIYRADDGTPQKPRRQLDSLATSIRALDADLIALAEVENRGILELFNDVLLADMGYKHVVQFEGNDRRGIDVALLSRVPVGPVTSFRHLTFPDKNGTLISFRRDLLRVRIEPEGGTPFDMYLVHFKSRGGTDDQGLSTRLGEAEMTRKLLDQQLAASSDANFVVCGDFNASLESPTLETIIGTGNGALKHFVDEIPEEDRVTYNQNPYRSMIDFILASPTMAKRYVPGSYRIVQGSPEISGSDHNPVVAKFRLQ